MKLVPIRAGYFCGAGVAFVTFTADFTAISKTFLNSVFL